MLNVQKILRSSREREVEDVVHLDAQMLDQSALGDITKFINIRDLFLKGNAITDIQGIEKLVHLRQLDLSCNRLSRLPGPEVWLALPKLRMLDLFQNSFRTLDALQSLVGCKLLVTLTCYWNPVSIDPDYRFFLLRLIPNLLALDDQIAAEDETIDNAETLSMLHFGLKYASFADEMRLPQIGIVTRRMTKDEHKNRYQERLWLVHLRFAHHRPIIALQRVFRGHRGRMAYHFIRVKHVTAANRVKLSWVAHKNRKCVMPFVNLLWEQCLDHAKNMYKQNAMQNSRPNTNRSNEVKTPGSAQGEPPAIDDVDDDAALFSNAEEEEEEEEKEEGESQQRQSSPNRDPDDAASRKSPNASVVDNESEGPQLTARSSTSHKSLRRDFYLDLARLPQSKEEPEWFQQIPEDLPFSPFDNIWGFQFSQYSCGVYVHPRHYAVAVELAKFALEFSLAAKQRKRMVEDNNNDDEEDEEEVNIRDNVAVGWSSVKMVRTAHRKYVTPADGNELFPGALLRLDHPLRPFEACVKARIAKIRSYAQVSDIMKTVVLRRKDAVFNSKTKARFVACFEIACSPPVSSKLSGMDTTKGKLWNRLIRIDFPNASVRHRFEGLVAEVNAALEQLYHSAAAKKYRGLLGRSPFIWIGSESMVGRMTAGHAIRATMKSFLTRKLKIGNLHTMVLRRRAVICLQRWWRWLVVKHRLKTLTLIHQLFEHPPSLSVYADPDIMERLHEDVLKRNPVFPEARFSFGFDNGRVVWTVPQHKAIPAEKRRKLPKWVGTPPDGEEQVERDEDQDIRNDNNNNNSDNNNNDNSDADVNADPPRPDTVGSKSSSQQQQQQQPPLDSHRSHPSRTSQALPTDRSDASLREDQPINLNNTTMLSRPPTAGSMGSHISDDITGQLSQQGEQQEIDPNFDENEAVLNDSHSIKSKKSSINHNDDNNDNNSSSNNNDDNNDDNPTAAMATSNRPIRSLVSVGIVRVQRVERAAAIPGIGRSPVGRRSLLKLTYPSSFDAFLRCALVLLATSRPKQDIELLLLPAAMLLQREAAVALQSVWRGSRVRKWYKPRKRLLFKHLSTTIFEQRLKLWNRASGIYNIGVGPKDEPPLEGGEASNAAEADALRLPSPTKIAAERSQEMTANTREQAARLKRELEMALSDAKAKIEDDLEARRQRTLERRLIEERASAPKQDRSLSLFFIKKVTDPDVRGIERQRRLEEKRSRSAMAKERHERITRSNEMMQIQQRESRVGNLHKWLDEGRAWSLHRQKAEEEEKQRIKDARDSSKESGDLVANQYAFSGVFMSNMNVLEGRSVQAEWQRRKELDMATSAAKVAVTKHEIERGKMRSRALRTIATERRRQTAEKSRSMIQTALDGARSEHHKETTLMHDKVVAMRMIRNMSRPHTTPFNVINSIYDVPYDVTAQAAAKLEQQATTSESRERSPLK